MIKVTVGNNVKRESVIIDENTTLRACLEANGVDYTRGVMHLDGSSLNPGDLDKTFASFGITEKCFLLNVVKLITPKLHTQMEPPSGGSFMGE